MPRLVSMIHDTIAEATHTEFLEDTTPSKQDISRNDCSSVFFQMASNPHLGSAKFQKIIKEAMGPIKKESIGGKNIDQLRAKHKGKTAVSPVWTTSVSSPITPPPTEMPIDTRAATYVT
eukprot:jgi/Psemu1/2478/gm1.2478_g